MSSDNILQSDRYCEAESTNKNTIDTKAG